jgi:hypothetical protein
MLLGGCFVPVALLGTGQGPHGEADSCASCLMCIQTHPVKGSPYNLGADPYVFIPPGFGSLPGILCLSGKARVFGLRNVTWPGLSLSLDSYESFKWHSYCFPKQQEMAVVGFTNTSLLPVASVFLSPRTQTCTFCCPEIYSTAMNTFFFLF